MPAGAEFTITRSLPHGHVAAVTAMARKLGLPGLLGPAVPAAGSGVGADRVAGGAARLEAVHPAWWADTTLGADLGVAGAATDEVYAAMDWLPDRQDGIEKQLAARHLGPR